MKKNYIAVFFYHLVKKSDKKLQPFTWVTRLI